MADPPTPLESLRQTFFAEAEELVEALNDGLLQIEAGTQDSEAIHVLFRAVHSIKGSAGAFGLDTLVRFAHRFETFLDGFREAGTPPAGQALTVCFNAADLLADLVQSGRNGSAPPEDRLAGMLAELDQADGPGASDPIDAAAPAFEPVALALDPDLPPDQPAAQAEGPVLPPRLPDVPQGAGVSTYRIEFQPSADLMNAGHDPVHLLRALSDAGIAKVRCRHADVPALDRLAPEVPLLHWTVTLETDAEQAEIEAVFEFVEGLCHYEITDVSDQTIAPPPRAVAPPSRDKSAIEGRSIRPAQAIRVDLERIERLVNLVGELVINQSMLSQSLAQSGLPVNAAAMNGVEEFHRLTRDIQESVMMIRAQPVKSLFQRMSRVVRETAAQTGKQARLITSGETTEVDKTVIEALADPLTHMIRNAVDHGIERPPDRKQRGKPQIGALCLSAAHRSGRVIIELQDDGAGIDRDRVRQKAIAMGLIRAEDRLTDSEIDNLLFEPGFSTADALSDFSGRGVGMDVVMTAIGKLGGKITLRSAPERGTRISISVPLTLAVTDGMIVQVAGHAIVIPLNMVAETMNLSADNTFTLQPGITAVRGHDGLIPLWDLGAILEYHAPLTGFEDKIAILVKEEDQVHAALVVDAISDQRQVVIKGLDDPMCQAPGITAATILGDGKVALILDPAALITPLAGGRESASPGDVIREVRQ